MSLTEDWIKRDRRPAVVKLVYPMLKSGLLIERYRREIVASLEPHELAQLMDWELKNPEPKPGGRDWARNPEDPWE